MTGNHRIRKQSNTLNGRWSKSEHERFVKGLDKFGKNWVEVQKLVKTRTLTQVRSHAQKVFLSSDPNELNISMSSQNSDVISYQETSFQMEGQSKNNLNIENYKRLAQKKTPKVTNAASTEKNTGPTFPKEIESPPTRQEQDNRRNNLHLPSTEVLSHYNSVTSKPSYFITCLIQNHNFLNNGGNFIQLCLRNLDHSQKKTQ